MPMTDKSKSHANKGHADPDKAGRDQYKRHIDGDITIRGRVETNVPPDAVQQHTTEREEDKTQGKRKFVVEVLTLIAVIIYAGITFWQGCLTKRLAHTADQTLSTSREQFLKSERPYVWPGELASIPMEVGKALRVNVYFLNYGKTPAIKEKSNGQLLVATTKSVLDQADEFFAAIKDHKFESGSEIILPPGIIPDPQKSQAFVSYSSQIIPGDKNIANALMDTDGSFGVVGAVVYEDTAGSSYTTYFCALHSKSGVMVWCPRHNEIR
ncbi:MAG: hypothetical protein JWQ87_2949 [Candidatus Sulfotelmatobacter sp.]|nr:hypothetical protein [Candidatus Sulfotelmatobacter sp.]